MPEKVTIEFQPYELQLIQEGLKLLKEKSGRVWERQPNGDFNYTPNKRSKQIDFVSKSITRQSTKELA